MRTTRIGLFCRVFLAGGLAAFGVASLVSACGARTGLEVPPPTTDATDASDAEADVHHDADAEVRIDADADADVEADADAEVEVFNDCPDAGSTFIYVVTESGRMYSFYPPSASFVPVGVGLACPLIDSNETVKPSDSVNACIGARR